MNVQEVYPAFPKVPRLRRPIVITEKIDGTNALVHVANDGTVRAGSRTQWITPERDNFGFAAWVMANEEELRSGLGPGLHYGEWWGRGIQRGYGLADRYFSLFNTRRWGESRPSCCSVVPVIGLSDEGDIAIERCMRRLRADGSVAVPGWMKPEGVVVFHTASQTMGKVLLEDDDKPKGEVR
jgi:RNA ligase